MEPWLRSLKTDPRPALLAWDDPALVYFVRRDLLEQDAGPAEVLWETEAAVNLVRRQGPDGSWRYPGKSYDPVSNTNYNLLETYRSLRLLVEMYAFDRSHPALEKAAGYLFSCQTGEGDIRGILGSQYIPYYHGAILELLVKAGYGDDLRLEKGLQWLLGMRQDDGAWLIPAQAVPPGQKTRAFWHAPPVEPDRARPFSHIATGMILRAFAVHPGYCRRPEVRVAGECLKARFFKPDLYNDRKGADYWLKFQYPFWWPTLLTGLDTLFRLGFEKDDPDVARGLEWFLTDQAEDGLWGTGYGSGPRAEENRRWVGLAACRALKAFFG